MRFITNKILKLTDKELIELYNKQNSYGGWKLWVELLLIYVIFKISLILFFIGLVIFLLWASATYEYKNISIIKALKTELKKRGLYEE